jgi:amphi-Trp domain-containing protein
MSESEANPESVESEADSESPAAEAGSESAAGDAGSESEEEFRLDASEAGRFLIELGEALRDDDELTIATDEWEVPFTFGEPVDLEVDFDGTGEPELEIEVELPGRTDERAPSVE